MTRIRGTSLAEIQFRANDTAPTRAQKLELIRDILVSIVGEDGETFPPHTHEISEIIELQDALDALRLTLYYRFGAFWVSAPTASETMMLHSVTDDITLYADMAGSVGDISGLPVAPMEFTVWKAPTFTAEIITGGLQIGTMTVDVDGSFTFTTTNSQPVNLYVGDVVGVKAPASVESTAIGGTFTFLALLGAIEDYLALQGDMTDGDDVLLLAGDMQDGNDLLVLVGE